jgi:uncharacterized protein (UPF0276 family)
MKCGLGIRPELFAPVCDRLPELGFLEAHSENYFGQSLARAKLLELREHYPISLHGVGLSLGRADNLNKAHLSELKSLVDEIQPSLVSEHLAWSAYSHRHLPDLLPLPLNPEAFEIMCRHGDQMQSALGRQILVENPSNYLLFDEIQISEPEFLNSLASRTGCGLLVDVNNIHVSASNLQRDAKQYLDSLDSVHISQYHLAGHTQVRRPIENGEETVLIDTHNQIVSEPVWDLFEYTLNKHGVRPTLLEWDSDFPEFKTVLAECNKADQFLMDRSPATLLTSIKTPSIGSVGEGLALVQEQFLDAVISLNNQLASAKPGYQQRIGVYQNNVFAACQDYLADVFPATRGVLGADYFKQVAQTMIQSKPPVAGNIYHYGVELSESLSQLEALQDMPYLADLVEFEWALHTAYFADTSDCIEPEAMGQQELLTLPIDFNNSVVLIDSQYPIYQIHHQSLPQYDQQVQIDLDQSQDNLVVYKLQQRVVSEIWRDLDFAVLQAIKKNKNLLQAIESLTGSISAETLTSSLTRILNARLLIAISD